jgi:hypothetical protein
MTRIVTSTYRYKPPPRKRAKAAAIEGPTIVTAAKPGRRKPPTPPQPPPPADRKPTADLGPDTGKKSAIVTARRPGKPARVLPPACCRRRRRSTSGVATAPMPCSRR